MHSESIVRHALILVFDYKLEDIVRQRGVTILDPPTALPAMDVDLTTAYTLALNRFRIERKNITVVTDVKPRLGQYRPWDPMLASGDNPRVVHLECPDICVIVREIAQFVENTVRGIDDIVSKGLGITNEVFIYVSCHGAQVPSISPEDESDTMDNALIFMTKRPDNVYEKRYLRSNDIFNLFFGHNFVTPEGIMHVPITRRTRVLGTPKTPRYHVFEDDEVCVIRLTPTIPIDSRSIRHDYATAGTRGLPSGTHMLVIFDTCHSGTMAKFHYFYDSASQQMKPTDHLPCGHRYPYCVSLSASEDCSDAPSTSNGSLFTRCVYNIFASVHEEMTIQAFHEMIYATMHKFLHKCKPTICSTYCDHQCGVPFLT